MTSTAAELNILDGVTSTAAELNLLDGVTSTTAELNLLDGVTATTVELNYVDGVTSNVQTQIDSASVQLALTSIHSLEPQALKQFPLMAMVTITIYFWWLIRLTEPSQPWIKHSSKLKVDNFCLTSTASPTWRGFFNAENPHYDWGYAIIRV